MREFVRDAAVVFILFYLFQAGVGFVFFRSSPLHPPSSEDPAVFMVIANLGLPLLVGFFGATFLRQWRQRP